MKVLAAVVLSAASAVFAPAAAQDAQDPEEARESAEAPGPQDDAQAIAAFEATLTYRQGEITLGDGLAVLRVPESFRFLGPDDAQRLLVEGWGNPPGDKPLGMLIPSGVSPLADEGWGVIITYEEEGYVEDDDATSLDYDALLREMQEDARASNKQREEMGYPPVELVGWAEPPHYDAESHKLYWAKELRFGDEPLHTLNYNIRVLGRRGVLVLNAVGTMDQLASIANDMRTVLGFVEFNPGHRYADFVPGADKVAAYGIAGLIAGKVAVKAGLVKVLIGALAAGKKFIILGVVAIGAFARKLFGRRKAKESEAAA